MQQKRSKLFNKRNRPLVIGSAIIFVFVAATLLSIVYTPYPPEAQNASVKLAPPTFAHPFGADNLGRDILSRILVGAGTTLQIALITIAIGAGAGAVIGALTGYYGGIIDAALMRFNDTITAFPSILLALVLISFMGPGKYNVTLALGILFIPSFARIIRAEFATLKHHDYITNARLMGAKPARIMLLHILPNTKTTLLSSVAIGFNNAVLAESGMSYLGIGVQPPEPSLGRMLSESQMYLFSSPWYAAFTGSAIVLMILGFSLIGDGVRVIDN